MVAAVGRFIVHGYHRRVRRRYRHRRSDRPLRRRPGVPRDDVQRAWPRRRADLPDIAGIDSVLTEIGARAEELDRRTAAVLALNTHQLDQRTT